MRKLCLPGLELLFLHITGFTQQADIVFNIGGKVTAADASDDGKRIVVITYTVIWIFERTDIAGSYFNGHIWWLPVKAPQIESVCFKDAATLWLLDEEKSALYEVPVSKLMQVK